jgi:hypothetical protein
MDNRSLITRIANAFPVEPSPTKENVLYKGAYSGDPELEEIRDYFGARPWKSLAPIDVFHFRHALSFLSPLALAYFTPAWMTCSLADEATVDTAIQDLTGTLGRADPSLWTQEQRSLICEWLVHFRAVPLKPELEKAAKHLGCAMLPHN